MVALSSLETHQAYLRSKADGLHLYLPTSEVTWDDLWHHLKWHLQAHRPFWQRGCSLTLWADDRLLSTAELQAIATLVNQHQLTLRCVQTRHRSTAVAAAQLGYSVQQALPLTPVSPPEAQDLPLYLDTTVRSGVEVRHRGSVIVLGDVNPGGQVIASGDVVILGRLKGVAHAGYPKDPQHVIVALYMEPMQLRIADQVARPPEDNPDYPVAEVAYLKDQVICIAGLQDYLSVYRNEKEQV